MIYNLVKMAKINLAEAGSYSLIQYYKVLTFENLQAAKQKWIMKHGDKE